MATDVDWEDFDGFDNFGISICTSGTRPSGGALHEGRFIYETDTNLTKYYDGAAWQTLAAGGGTKKIFVPWTHNDGFTETYDGDFAALSVDENTNAACRGNVQIPPDFSSGAKVYAIAKSTETDTGDLEVYVDYGSIGQAPATHSASAGGSIELTANQISKSAECSLASAVAGDFVGIKLLVVAAVNTCTLTYVYGFILEYTA